MEVRVNDFELLYSREWRQDPRVARREHGARPLKIRVFPVAVRKSSGVIRTLGRARPRSAARSSKMKVRPSEVPYSLEWRSPTRSRSIGHAPTSSNNSDALRQLRIRKCKASSNKFAHSSKKVSLPPNPEQGSKLKISDKVRKTRKHSDKFGSVQKRSGHNRRARSPYFRTWSKE